MNMLMRRISRPEWVRAAAPILLCATLVNGGCARLPEVGLKASGEPLTVDITTEKRAYVAQEKTGEVVHRDANGNVIGTSEAYQDKLIQYDVTRWQVFQGDYKIDDQDFFRISGDDQAADEIANMRAKAVTVNRVGFGLLFAGIGILATGLIIQATQADSGRSAPVPYGGYVAGAGAVVGIVGGSLIWYGASAVKREHPLDDSSRAKRDAERYNETLDLPAEEKKPAEEPAEKPKKKKKKKKDAAATTTTTTTTTPKTTTTTTTTTPKKKPPVDPEMED